VELTASQVENLKILGESFAPVSAVANFLGLDPIQVRLSLQDKQSAISQAYWPALELQAAKLRIGIIDMASRDSSPAQLQAVKLLDKCLTQLYAYV
jgi:hypothetical protein